MIPHFDLPFRYSLGGRVVAVPQDSDLDVENCVAAIVRTHVGQRMELPEFGVPDITFRTELVKESDVIQQILRNEPRASVRIDEAMAIFDKTKLDEQIQVSNLSEDSNA